MKKTIYSIILIFFLAVNVYGQDSAQSINLKQGFNFVSFTVQPGITPQQLKNQYPAIEDVYLYSAAAGSFLSALDGSLTSLNAGKGYIIKVNEISGITLSITGTALSTALSANLKPGFNLIGISLPPVATTFSQLMNKYTIIKGVYKWSPAAGGFVQVIKNEQGQPVQIEGVDPQFKIGESYFINVNSDVKMNFNEGYITLDGGSVTAEKTLEITGEIGNGTLLSYALSSPIDFSGSNYYISLFDEINNIPIEGASISLTGSNTFKATIPLGDNNRYAVIVVKESSGKAVFKNLVGKIPKSSEVNSAKISLSGIKVDEQTTAKTLLILEDKTKVPDDAVTTSDFNAVTAKTEFDKKVDERISGIDNKVNELVKAIEVISKILISSNVNPLIKSKVTAKSLSDITSLLNSFVDILQDTAELAITNKITVPPSIVIGNNVIDANTIQTPDDIAKTANFIKTDIKDQVAAPIINPPGGACTASQLITINCATSGAIIKYTTDGTEPSLNNGIDYTGTIAMPQSAKIAAKAFKDGMIDSKTIKANYTINGSTNQLAVTSAGGILTLSDGIIFEIPPNSVDSSCMINIIEDNFGFEPVAGQKMYKITSTGNVYGLTIHIPIKPDSTKEDVTLVYAINGYDVIYPEAAADDSKCTYNLRTSSSAVAKANSPISKMSSVTVPVVSKDKENKCIIATKNDPECIKNLTDICELPDKTIQVPMPYYRQYGGTCWTTSLFMLMKGYNKNLNEEHDSFYKVVHLLKDYIDESSHGITMPDDVIRETLIDLIDKMSIPEKVKMISGITMKNPSYCADEEILFQCLIKVLSQKIPVVVGSRAHAMLVFGCKFNGDLTTNMKFDDLKGKTDFWIHDPNITPLKSVKFDDILNRLLLNKSDLPADSIVFSPGAPPAGNSYLQTIHLSQNEGIKHGNDNVPYIVDKVISNFEGNDKKKSGVVFEVLQKNGKPGEYANTISAYAYGEKSGRLHDGIYDIPAYYDSDNPEVIEFENIVLNKIPIFNTANKAKNVSVTLSLLDSTNAMLSYQQALKSILIPNGSIPENISIPGFELYTGGMYHTQFVPTASALHQEVYVLNANQLPYAHTIEDFRELVKKFKIKLSEKSINNKEFKLKVGLSVPVADNQIPTDYLDFFSLKFKYTPLIVKVIKDSNANIKFEAYMNDQKIINDLIWIVMDGDNILAENLTGSFSSTLFQMGKNYTAVAEYKLPSNVSELHFIDVKRGYATFSADPENDNNSKQSLKIVPDKTSVRLEAGKAGVISFKAKIVDAETQKEEEITNNLKWEVSPADDYNSINQNGIFNYNKPGKYKIKCIWKKQVLYPDINLNGVSRQVGDVIEYVAYADATIWSAEIMPAANVNVVLPGRWLDAGCEFKPDGVSPLNIKWCPAGDDANLTRWMKTGGDPMRASYIFPDIAGKESFDIKCEYGFSNDPVSYKSIKTINVKRPKIIPEAPFIHVGDIVKFSYELPQGVTNIPAFTWVCANGQVDNNGNLVFTAP
ncbi:MAG TPA: chitobiase/beta-hexosaminidase C-terminal domain-containing protein, partial [Candidatus Wallbacteria bacterium]|nr:chitobiase/beta-hexosaminidase C-terminal domain-containing protein [Candidatus Wallbacteria bacterium]